MVLYSGIVTPSWTVPSVTGHPASRRLNMSLRMKPHVWSTYCVDESSYTVSKHDSRDAHVIVTILLPASSMNAAPTFWMNPANTLKSSAAVRSHRHTCVPRVGM